MKKSDLISRADAIGAVRKELVCDGTHETHDKVCRFIADVILPALPSAKGGDAEMNEVKPQYMQVSPSNGADLISREDALNLSCIITGRVGEVDTIQKCFEAYRDHIEALPSADAYTEQQVRDAFNSGYSCGMEQTKEALSAAAVEPIHDTEWGWIKTRRDEGLLASAEAEWIPCSERLPKEKQEVYVTVYFIEGDTGRAYGYMDGFGRWHLYSTVEGTLNSGYEVTAWMPLPKPSREDGEA